jgi:hypothetical protein
MEHSKFTNANALLEFLNQNGIPAIPSVNADPVMLHWWEFEGIKRITDVAILSGRFFLAVLESGFSLHVYNERNDWYNYVRVWKSNIPEMNFLQDIKSIIHSDESQVWFCVRETYFEFEWQRTISDIQNIEQVSPELKTKIFNLQETLVETPKLMELKQAILDLLALFIQDDVRNWVNCLIMQRYFPPSRYARWALPAEFKLLLSDIGDVFGKSNLPTQIELNNIILRAKDLLD